MGDCAEDTLRMCCTKQIIGLLGWGWNPYPDNNSLACGGFQPRSHSFCCSLLEKPHDRAMVLCLKMSFKLVRLTNRDDRIWTYDILLPKQARYQAALHPVINIIITYYRWDRSTRSQTSRSLVRIPKHPLNSFRIFHKPHSTIKTHYVGIGK